jgi:hypothetical protein
VPATDRAPDLAWLPASGVALDERPEVAVARAAARSLYEALAMQAEAGRPGSLAQRIRVHIPCPRTLQVPTQAPLPDGLRARVAWLWSRAVARSVARLRSLGRRGAASAPTLVFQPVNGWETARALAWACARGLHAAPRGRGPSASGTPLPANRAGLLLDMSRIDAIGVDARRRVALVGAGVRAAPLQARLAESGLSLLSCPADPRTTVAAWIASGDLGRDAFAHGAGVEQVRWAEVVLLQGLHLRVYQDGTLEVLDDPGSPPERLDPTQAAEWFAALELPHLRPADFAGSGRRRGVIVSALVDVGPSRAPRPHLVPFAGRTEALDFARTVAEEAERTGRLPLNLEYWPAARSPAGSIADARGGCVYVDFDDPAAEELLGAAAFAGPLASDRPDAAARALTDRLIPSADDGGGPRQILADLLLDSRAVPGFLEAVERLARRARMQVDSDIRYLRRARARVVLTCPAGPGLRRFLAARALRLLIERGRLVRNGRPRRNWRLAHPAGAPQRGIIT